MPMLQFNELNISSDRKYLIIDAQVQDLEFYDDVYISDIIVDTQNSFIATGPSDNPIYHLTCEDDVKHIRKYIDIDSIQNNLFFVYILTSGQPSDDTPCGMKHNMITGVAYDKYSLYRLGMEFIGQVDGCEIPRNLLDYIFRTKALDIAIDTGNYAQAITYWKKLFAKNKSLSIVKPCGCYAT